MSESYIATAGNDLLMIGKTRSPVPPDALTRSQAAILFDTGTDPGEVEGEAMAASVSTGIRCRSATTPDGQLLLHREDVDAIRAEQKRQRSQPTPRRSSAPAPVRRIEFSDTTDSAVRTPSGDDAIRVAEAATQAGITEDAMRERLIGKATLAVVDGELVARRGDLQRLSEAGAIPKPSEARRVERETAEAEGQPPSDPAVEKRTAQVAAAIGIDSGRMTSPPAEPTSPKTEQQDGAGVNRASAKPRRRLGAPQRWGERT